MRPPPDRDRDGGALKGPHSSRDDRAPSGFALPRSLRHNLPKTASKEGQRESTAVPARGALRTVRTWEGCRGCEHRPSQIPDPYDADHGSEVQSTPRRFEAARRAGKPRARRVRLDGPVLELSRGRDERVPPTSFFSAAGISQASRSGGGIALPGGRKLVGRTGFETRSRSSRSVSGASAPGRASSWEFRLPNNRRQNRPSWRAAPGRYGTPRG